MLVLVLVPRGAAVAGAVHGVAHVSVAVVLALVCGQDHAARRRSTVSRPHTRRSRTRARGEPHQRVCHIHTGVSTVRECVPSPIGCVCSVYVCVLLFCSTICMCIVIF